MASFAEYDRRYLEFFRLWDMGDYFECHEVLEELWLETGDDFFKGLIQVAVAVEHACRGNLRGTFKVLERARGYLRAAAPRYMGLDVDRLLAELDRLEAHFERVRRGEKVTLPEGMRFRGPFAFPVEPGVLGPLA